MLCFTMVNPDESDKTCNITVDIPIVPISGINVKDILTDISLIKWKESSCIARICIVDDSAVYVRDVLERFPDYNGAKLFPLSRYSGKAWDVAICSELVFHEHYSKVLGSQEFRNFMARENADFLLHKIVPMESLGINVKNLYSDLYQSVFKSDNPCPLDYINRLLQLTDTFRVVPLIPNECVEWCVANAPKALTCCSTHELLSTMLDAWCLYYTTIKEN